jgi:hypothetical protein
MYSQIVSDLEKASVPVKELHGPGVPAGDVTAAAAPVVAVTLAAGRIVALAFSKDGPNLFWTHPDLGDTELVTANPTRLVGGIGGDRLWFSPELRYHWVGKPDWHGLGNYKVPADTDPGHYRFVDSEPGVVALEAKGRLPVQGSDHWSRGTGAAVAVTSPAGSGDVPSGEYLAFSVERKIRMAQPPLSLDDPLMRSVRYVGIEAVHELTIQEETRTGEIDLWHLLQAPVGSTLIVPLRPGHRTQPLSYGLPGAWRTTPNSVIWRIEGNTNAKIGIAAEALTGRSAILRRLSSKQWCLMVRQFPVDVSARYGDYPEGVPRDDQVFQAWDGLGFGEMEFHSPVLDAERGPRALREKDQLWAFGGSAQTILALADILLHVDIRAALSQES